MNNIKRSRFCRISVLVGIITIFPHTATAFSFSTDNSPGNNQRTTSNRPWGNLGAFKPGLKVERNSTYSNQGNSYNYSYSYSTQAPNNVIAGNPYIGSAPGTGWPGAMNQMTPPRPMAPYGQQMPIGATSYGQPRIEIAVSETNPYEQQNLVYTVRVVSSKNFKTLDPILPSIEGAVLEKVDGPAARIRESKGAREIVNEYHYKLTPFRTGEIVIPAIRFKGAYAAERQWGGMPGQRNSGAGEKITISSGTPVTLDVLAADNSVKPWLPLHNLRLQADMQQGRHVAAGKPVTLKLELSARGAPGEQLPSLEAQLKNAEFRVYKESSTFKNGIARNGKYLTGTRTETYTLIPLKDGFIRLPSLSVPWWDVDTGSLQLAEVPGISGSGAGGAAGAAPLNTRSESTGSIYFWIPLLLMLGLIIGYWLGAWNRTGPLAKSAAASVGKFLQPVKHQLVGSSHALWQALTPSVYVNKLRMGLAVLMPVPMKMWLCTRCVEQEDNPGEWCVQFKSRICQHLKIANHTPLPLIAEKIIEANPQAEPAKLRSLIHSLDGAIYGAQPLDFPAWKNDFRSQLRPRLYRRRRSAARRSKSVLPALNPRSA